MKDIRAEYLLKDILSEIAADKHDRLSCREILDMIAEKKRNRIESVRTGSYSEEYGETDEGEDNLVNADNARIPGGKTNPSQPLKFVYDPQCKSVRRYIEV